MKWSLYLLTVIAVVSCEMRLPGAEIPTAPPSEEGSAPESTIMPVTMVADPQAVWVRVSAVILGKDSKTKPKLDYIKTHNFQLYEDFINRLTSLDQNGWVSRVDLDSSLQIFYDLASRMPLDAIKNGQETFGGRVLVIRNNELAYQTLLSKLTADMNQQGFISREYAQRAVSEAYWKLKFSVWYATAKLYAGKASMATRNFFDTAIAPRLRGAWNTAGGWAGQKRVQMSDWYRKVRNKDGAL